MLFIRLIRTIDVFVANTNFWNTPRLIATHIFIPSAHYVQSMKPVHSLVICGFVIFYIDLKLTSVWRLHRNTKNVTRIFIKYIYRLTAKTFVGVIFWTVYGSVASLGQRDATAIIALPSIPSTCY